MAEAPYRSAQRDWYWDKADDGLKVRRYAHGVSLRAARFPHKPRKKAPALVGRSRGHAEQSGGVRNEKKPAPGRIRLLELSSDYALVNALQLGASGLGDNRGVSDHAATRLLMGRFYDAD